MGIARERFHKNSNIKRAKPIITQQKTHRHIRDGFLFSSGQAQRLTCPRTPVRRRSPRLAHARRDDEAALVQHGADVGQHMRAAADHRAVGFGIDLGNADVLAELAAFHELGNAALVAERLARDGRVIDQLFAHHVAEEFVVRQFAFDEVGVGQFADPAHAVHQDDLVEAFVDVRVLDDAHEGRQAGAGAEQEQVLAGLEVVDHQRAHRLAADQNGVALFQVLQARGERAVLHLDAEEFEVFFVVGAGDAVGPQQRLAFDFEADHHEVAVVEPQGRVTRRGEGKQGVVPVVHAQYALSIESSHVASS